MKTAAVQETPSHASGLQAEYDPFALHIVVVDEPLPNAAETACDTNDGCKATCASSCTSASS